MNAVIVKSSTTIAVFDNFKYSPKRDGGFDTAMIMFESTDNALLDIGDRVTFLNQTWRVSNPPKTRINTESNPNWLYTVELVEKAFLLKGHPMPNITFTQNSAQTKTIADAVTSVLNKAQVLYVGESPRYTLKASPSVGMTALAPDDTFEGLDLYQILKYYAEILDAKVVVDENDIIDFIPLNDYVGSVAPESYSEIEITRSMEDYATGAIMDVENAETQRRVQSYPHRQTAIYLLPADITEDVDSGATSSYNNLRITTPFKIKRVISITVYDKKTPPNAFTLFSEEDAVLHPIRYIFEKQEWETLRQKTISSFIPGSYLWGALRENSLYWEYGKNEIGNLKALQKHIVDITAYARDLTMIVEYEALPDVQIDYKTSTLLDGAYEFITRETQNGSTVNFDAERQRIRNLVQNKQATFYNATWQSETIPSIRNRVLIDGRYCLIQEMIATREGEQYIIAARLATTYNKRSPLTKLVSPNRIFEIPSKQTTVRKVVFDQIARISMLWNETANSDSKWASFRHNLLFNLQDSGGSYYDGQVIAIIRFKYADSNIYIAAAMPQMTILADNVIVNIMRMISNTAVDWQSFRKFDIPVVSTAQTAIVTDANGENELALLKYKVVDSQMIVDSASSTVFQNAFPFVSSGFFDSTNIGGKKHDFAICSEIQVKKDRREQLQFEHRLKLLGGSLGTANRYASSTIVDWAAVLDASKFRTALAETEVNVVIATSATAYALTATVTFYDAYITIGFTSTVTGNIVRMALKNSVTGNEILSRQLNNQAVVSGQNYYVTITIKES